MNLESGRVWVLGFLPVADYYACGHVHVDSVWDDEELAKQECLRRNSKLDINPQLWEYEDHWVVDCYQLNEPEPFDETDGRP